MICVSHLTSESFHEVRQILFTYILQIRKLKDRIKCLDQGHPFSKGDKPKSWVTLLSKKNQKLRFFTMVSHPEY